MSIMNERDALAYIDIAVGVLKARCAQYREALEAVQHNRLCACYLVGGPCPRCVVGYNEVDAVLERGPDPQLLHSNSWQCSRCGKVLGHYDDKGNRVKHYPCGCAAAESPPPA